MTGSISSVKDNKTLFEIGFNLKLIYIEIILSIMHQIIANNGRHALGVGKIRRNKAELTLAL